MACPHDMPTPGSCVDCMTDGPVAPPTTWRKVGRPQRAIYPATCMCGDEILVGDAIQRWDFGSEQTRYLHERCVIR